MDDGWMDTCQEESVSQSRSISFIKSRFKIKIKLEIFSALLLVHANVNDTCRSYLETLSLQ